MPTTNGDRPAPHQPGALTLTDIHVLPENAISANLTRPQFTYRYTTGPFSLPEHSGALDWILLNNDSKPQQARVTVFTCPIGSVKTPAAPGPLVVTINPGTVTHNGNRYTEGFVYEIQVECNSRLVLPYVAVWPGNFGVTIPGTAITAGQFMQMMPSATATRVPARTTAARRVKLTTARR